MVVPVMLLFFILLFVLLVFLLAVLLVVVIPAALVAVVISRQFPLSARPAPPGDRLPRARCAP